MPVATSTASAGGGATSNASADESPPPGAGVHTVICAVVRAARSAAGIAAVSCTGLTYVVGRSAPSHRTTELAANPVPFTVIEKAAPPIGAAAGDNDVNDGGPATTVMGGLVAARVKPLLRNRRNSYVPGVEGAARGHGRVAVPAPTCMNAGERLVGA